MTSGTFTTSKGKIKFRYLDNPEIWCEETQQWIGSDEERERQEKQISKLIYKGKSEKEAERIVLTETFK